DGGLELFDDPLESRYIRPVTLFAGGAGLVSTTEDYARFCQMLLNGGELDGARILSPKTVQLMRMDHLADEASVTYYTGVGFGLGFGVIENIEDFGALGTNGTYFWGGAASTAFWIDPKENLAVVFMTQMIPSNTYPLRPELKTLVYQAMTSSNLDP
ncbi:MAG: serine hydrolase, partial [Alphaproteobacteria bacterium]|nr:serine hydrolase [Alphaproteobacteria bacterium]